MQKNKSLPTLAWTLLAIALCPPQGTAATAYFGFTRLDPASKTVTEQSYVVIEGRRIIAVGRGGPPTRPGWEYVDMSGRYAYCVHGVQRIDYTLQCVGGAGLRGHHHP